MKRLFYVIFVLGLMIGLFPQLGMAATEASPLVVDLIAGQHTDVGDIKVWDDGQNLYVRYETVEPWCLTETHLAVASDLEGIPQKNGNPIPGQFPYKTDHKECATSFTYTVPLIQDSCELYIAAHAAINSGETAWGAGLDFPGKNWATYFTYIPEACSCQPIFISGAADFSLVDVGQSVEGLGRVAPELNIDANGANQAVRIVQNSTPVAYSSPLNGGTPNQGLAGAGGFTDMNAQMAVAAHQYTFTFAPGVSINDFSLRMLDFGDYNPTMNTYHFATMTAYGTNNIVVWQQQLSYTTDPGTYYSPRYGQLFGDAGDSGFATAGEPGNWTWNVHGDGILQVVLSFGPGFDPNIGFNTLTYSGVRNECVCRASGTANFSLVGVGESVEGLGMVAPELNIDANGANQAVRIVQNTAPVAYSSPLNGGTSNQGLTGGGGFTDMNAQIAVAAHQYTFTFAPGTSVVNFALDMLDFGDYNPRNTTEHSAAMVAYAGNDIISQHTLNYTTNPSTLISKEYGQLFGDAGDSGYAMQGEPGNWTWHVSGNAETEEWITSVKLVFADPGQDPNIGFKNLMYTTVGACP